MARTMIYALILAVALCGCGREEGDKPRTAYVPPSPPKERVAAKEEQMSNEIDGWQLFAHGNLKNTVAVKHVLISDARKLLNVSADTYARTLVGDSVEGDWR